MSTGKDGRNLLWPINPYFGCTAVQYKFGHPQNTPLFDAQVNKLYFFET